MSNLNQIKVNCLIIGPAGVGKSTFVQRMVNQGDVSKEYSMTSSVDVHHKTYTNMDKQLQIDYCLVDLPGRPLYEPLVVDIVQTLMAKQNADASTKSYCMLLAMFDVTDPSSLASLSQLMGKLNTNHHRTKGVDKAAVAATHHLNGLNCIVIGNKIDLSGKRIVSNLDGNHHAKSLKARYLECSSLNFVPFDELHQLTIDYIHDGMDDGGGGGGGVGSGKQSISTPLPIKKAATTAAAIAN